MSPLILGLLLVTTGLFAQPGPSNLYKLTIIPRDGVQTIRIPLPSPPNPNDDLVLWLPTRRLSVALLTPNGKRLTSSNAADEGYDWQETRQLVDSDEADSPRTVSIRFREGKPAGEYQFEVTPVELTRIVEVTAAHRPEVGGAPGMAPSSAPTMITRGPASAFPKAILEFGLDQDEDGATVDILVSDPSVKLGLQLPQGLTLEPANSQRYGITWKVTDNPATLDAPGGLFSVSGFYIQEPGFHNVLHFPRAVRGVYRVIAEAKAAATVKVGFFPTARLAQSAFDVFERVAQHPTSDVKLTFDALPQTLHTGDSVPLSVEFTGEPVRRPVHFEVEFAYGESKRTLPLQFGWSLDNAFRSYFQPEREGPLKIKVKATGRTITGVPFTTTAESGLIFVKPLAARLMGVWEQAFDADRNALLDRLDINVELEVLQPGAYEMALQLRSRGDRAVPAKITPTLQAGRQRVTFSFTAAQVRSLVIDGPFYASDLEIRVRAADGSVDTVPTYGLRITTQPYRQAQWGQSQ